MTIEQALQQAVAYHQAGQITQAEPLYRAILQVQPNHPDANHNLGVLLRNDHKVTEALTYFKQALASNFKQPQFWLSYVGALVETQQFAVARDVLARGQAQGIHDEHFSAWAAYLAAPAVDDITRLSDFFNQKNFAAAESLARDLIAHFPQHGISYQLLTATLLQQQRLPEALALANTAVELFPDDAQAHYSFAVALKQQGDFRQAEQHCRTAIALQPNYIPAHYTLGIVLQSQGRLSEAAQSFQQAIALNPADEDVYNNLALILRDQYRFAEAENCYRTVLAMKPNYAAAHNNLGMLLQHQGRLAEAENCYRAALTNQADDANVYSNLLYLHHYSDVYTAEARVQEARNYGAMVAKKVAQPFNAWLCEPQPQKLRVGLVSGDFREHVVSYFLDNLLAHSDSSKIEWFAYSTNAATDSVTERLKSYFIDWQMIFSLSDQTAAQRIHADGIHILFDLSGHTNHNRLPVFAYRPAPLQISWLGYWATTGVAEIDYILVDKIGVPEQNHWQFTEKVHYLDNRLCFSAPSDELPVAALPVLTHGYITFGCFQNLTKVTDAVLKVWAEILSHLPNARLRFQAKQLNDKEFIEKFYARLTAHGIVAKCVSVHSSSARLDYLIAHKDVDFILDTFPFTGGTTTCEALWMGVPTLTLAGNSLVENQGASLLAAAGLADWIAVDVKSYIQKALVFASDFKQLAQLRCGLRERVLASPLFDGKRFARNFEHTLWELWQSSQPAPNPQAVIENIVTLFNQGLYAQAEPLARDLTVRFPAHFFGWKALGAILQSVGQLEESLLAQKKSVALCQDADAFYNLGITFKALDDLAAAEKSYLQAIALNPHHAQAWSNLGIICQQLERFAEAKSHYLQAIALKPDYAEAYNNLGHLLRQSGDLLAAERTYRQAIAINPHYAKAYNNLGCTLKELNRLQETEQCYRQAIEIKSDYGDAYNNLGILLQESGQLQAAEQCYRLALSYQPDLVEAYSNLGNVLKDQGNLLESEQSYLSALNIDPQLLVAHHNLLYTYNYTASYSAAFRLAAAKRFGKLVTAKVKQRFNHWLCESAPKCLRIGFVSGDFYEHAVCFFLENLLTQLVGGKLELIAYSAHHKVDTVTERIKPYFSAWRSLVGLSDEAAAQLIHQDGVHILFDLAGHTAHNRLPVFAWKPAPVQVAWLGYFATTGVAEMDAILVDEIGVPEKNHGHFTEKVCYLPDTRLCFSAPKMDIAVSTLPALSNGYITFGCFQNLTKVTDAVLIVWATILAQLPTAQLRLQSKQLADEKVVEALYARLARYGVVAHRLSVHGASSRLDYLAAHAQVDMILDTFPYTGGTTTCEALWMGVPTLTLAGDTLLARQGASLLAAAGLPDWIVEDEENYVAQAIVFASDLDKLAQLRSRLREHVLASALFDGERFAKHFEHTLWQLWRNYIAP